jgi:hypothetical protein
VASRRRTRRATTILSLRICAALDASNGATIRYLFDERSNWERDEYQFPRLLAEIMANVDLDDDMLRPVAESMELELDDVLELFNRAQLTWERVKAVTT